MRSSADSKTARIHTFRFRVRRHPGRLTRRRASDRAGRPQSSRNVFASRRSASGGKASTSRSTDTPTRRSRRAISSGATRRVSGSSCSRRSGSREIAAGNVRRRRARTVMFWLRSGGGTDFAVKRVIRAVDSRHARTARSSHGAPRLATSARSSSRRCRRAGASSKVRILVERSTDQPLDSAASYLPAADARSKRSRSRKTSFRVHAHKDARPGLRWRDRSAVRRRRQRQRLVTVARSRRAPLTLASSSAARSNNGDAWYDVYNDLSLWRRSRRGAVRVGASACCGSRRRCRSRRKRTARTTRASSNSICTSRRARANTASNPNPFHFSGWSDPVFQEFGFTFNVVTDGTTQRFPITYSPLAAFVGQGSPVSKIDYVAESHESGGSAPTAVWFDRFEGSAVYIGTSTGAESSLANSDVNITYIEEF
jgi:hypothetical protein